MGGGYRGGMHLEQNGQHFRSARAPHDRVGSEVQRRAPVVVAAAERRALRPLLLNCMQVAFARRPDQAAHVCRSLLDRTHPGVGLARRARQAVAVGEIELRHQPTAEIDPAHAVAVTIQTR